MGAVDVELPKWPGLLVLGKPLTREQTNEVLVRTNDWFSTCNDRAWEQDVFRLIGVQPLDGWPSYDAKELRAFSESVGALDLHYLRNERVMSCWIGGPHGWVDWSGRVEACNYNIGKWPSVGAVEEEWRAIAEAFPFLDLTCQLLDREAGEVRGDGDEARPLVEYRVQGGRVEVGPPVTELSLRHRWAAADADFFRRGRERGVDLGRLAEAVDQTRRSRAG